MQRNTVVTSDGPSTDELMETTFPLLLQCWIEVSASSVFEKDVETVQTMLCVLSITYSFCKERSSDSVTEYEKVGYLDIEILLILLVIRTYFKATLFLNWFFSKFEQINHNAIRGTSKIRIRVKFIKQKINCF